MEDGIWWILYYLRNKKKNKMPQRAKGPPFSYFFIFIWKWNDGEIKKNITWR